MATARGVIGLPVPYITDIHMYKIGPRIVPYAAGLQLHTDVPQPSCIITGDSDVDCFTLHV